MAYANAYPFTLIYHDMHTGENYQFHFYGDKEEICSVEFLNLLMLPAEELWRDYHSCPEDCDPDWDEVGDIAATYRVLAVVPGHVDVQFSPDTIEVDYKQEKPKLAVVG